MCGGNALGTKTMRALDQAFSPFPLCAAIRVGIFRTSMWRMAGGVYQRTSLTMFQHPSLSESKSFDPRSSIRVDRDGQFSNRFAAGARTERLDFPGVYQGKPFDPKGVRTPTLFRRRFAQGSRSFEGRMELVWSQQVTGTVAPEETNRCPELLRTAIFQKEIVRKPSGDLRIHSQL